MTYDTDYYISKISELSNRYGDKLIILMDRYNKVNLGEITLKEAKDFYEDLVCCSCHKI